jgi:hypothetical protein
VSSNRFGDALHIEAVCLNHDVPAVARTGASLPFDDDVKRAERIGLFHDHEAGV